MNSLKVYVFTLVVLFAIQLTAQKTNPNYNSELAKELDADAYGMKMYTLVLLHSGKNTDTTETRSLAFASYMKNINRLVENEKLVVAGPVGENDSDLRGIFILSTTNLDEAKSLLKNDVAIQQNYLSAQYFPYYGSATLPNYLKAHDLIWKEKP